MSKKKSILQGLITVILILYLTEIFRFSVFTGVSLSTFAFLSTFSLIIYILYNYKLYKNISQHRLFVLMSLFIFILPLISTPIYLYLGYIKPFELPRVVGNSLLYISLFLVSIIIGLKYNLKKIKTKIIIPSILIAIIGMIYNYFDPALFVNLKLRVLGSAELIDNDSLNSIQRTGGFYLKSTYAATCIIPLFFFLFSSEKVLSIKKTIFLFLLILIFIFITGSRSMLIFLIISLFYMRNYLTNILRYNRGFNISDSINLSKLFIILSTFIGVIGVISIASYLESTSFQNLGERVTSLTSSEIASDNSIEHRVQAQLFYINKIIENPIVGYGPIYMYNLIHKTEGVLSSHNSYLENTLRYGIIYLFLFVYTIYSIYKSTNRIIFSAKFNFDYIGFIIVFILYSSLASNTMWESKIIFILLGIAVGLSMKKPKSLQEQNIYKV